MIAIINLLIVLLPLMYGLAAVNYLVWFVRREPFAAKFSTPWMLLAVGSHALFIGLRALHFDRQPIGNIAESLSVVAFALDTIGRHISPIFCARCRKQPVSPRGEGVATAPAALARAHTAAPRLLRCRSARCPRRAAHREARARAQAPA